MTNYWDRPETSNLFIFSLVFGLSILDRTTMITLIIPFFLFTYKIFNWKNAIKISGTALTIAMLFPACWIARNYSIYHQVSLNSSFGQNLWIGIQEKSDGSTCMPDGETYYATLTDNEWEHVQQLSPPEQSHYFVSKYISVLRSDPERIVRMYFIKLKNFWWFRTGIGTAYNEKVNGFMPLYEIIYSSIFILSLLSLWLIGKKSMLLFSFPIALSLMHALFYVETRHRVIIEPLLLFFAIIGFFTIVKKLFSTKEAST